MTDAHLANSIALLQRLARNAVESELGAAIWASDFLQGDQALFQCEQDVIEMGKILHDESVDSVAESMFPKFKMLMEELERRDLAASGLTGIYEKGL